MVNNRKDASQAIQEACPTLAPHARILRLLESEPHHTVRELVEKLEQLTHDAPQTVFCRENAMACGCITRLTLRHVTEPDAALTPFEQGQVNDLYAAITTSNTHKKSEIEQLYNYRHLMRQTLAIFVHQHRKRFNDWYDTYVKDGTPVMYPHPSAIRTKMQKFDQIPSVPPKL